jgi:hypothetical protein
MSVRRFCGRRARIEALEPRQLLAGDVSVSVVEGNLIVEGDELENQVAITAGPEPGAYIVRGLDGTNIVQSPAPAEGMPPVSEVVVTGVTGGARIGLGAGDDRLVLANVGFRGGVSVRMGEGNDGVAIGLRPVPMPNAQPASLPPMDAPGSVRIGGPLNIGTGEGNDRVQIDQAGIGGQLHVETGMGDDVVRLGHAPPPPAEMPPATLAESAKPPEMQPALRVARGINVDLGAGHDELIADAVMAQHGLSINGGEGNDSLHAHHVGSGGPLMLLGGGGDGADRVDLAHVRAGTAVVMTGAGNDHVRIVDSVFRVLGVALGEGDDTLDLRGNAAQWAFFLGGEGTDALHDRGGNRFAHRFVHGFEPLPSPGDAVDPAVA